MLFLTLCLYYIKATVIPVNLLYERRTSDVVDKVHLWFFQQCIERYNTFLKDSEIFVALEEFRSLSSHKITYDELEFQIPRKDEGILRKPRDSTILIVDAMNPVKDKISSKNGSCRTSYTTSFTSEDGKSEDTLTKFMNAYRKWLSSVLNFDVPDIFDLEGESKMLNLVENLKNAKTKLKIKKCYDLNFSSETQEHGNKNEIVKQLEEILAKIKASSNGAIKKFKKGLKKNKKYTNEDSTEQSIKKNEEDSKDIKLLKKSFDKLVEN